MLNGNHGKPCPVKRDSIRLTAPAAAGSRLIQIDPAQRSRVVPGRTGITAKGIAAESLFTSVGSNGVARLSKPLGSSLSAGPLEVTTLRYEPFRPAT